MSQQVVLLVDDDVNLLNGLKRALRKEKYEVVCALRADDALNTLRSRHVDLIVADQNMPGMNGTTLLKKAHAEFPQVIRLMLTGVPSLEVAVNAINEGGISRFFVKPCNIVDLAVTIRQFLQQKTLRDESIRLLKRVRKQKSIIERMQKESPGLTQVKREDDGSVIIDSEDSVDDLDTLIDEIRETLRESQ